MLEWPTREAYGPVATETLTRPSPTHANLLDAGCGLIGIITAQLGAHVVFANSADLMPILKSNLANNCPESGHEIKEFDWCVPLPPIPAFVQF